MRSLMSGGRSPVAAGLMAALGVALAAAPAAAQHPGHAHAAGEDPAHAAAPGAHRFTAEGVDVEVSVTSAVAGASGLIEGRDAEVRIAFRDEGSGAPLSGLRPLAWIERRIGGRPFGPEECRQKVQMYLQGRIYPEGSIRAHADVDLNSFYVLTLNRSPDIAVIDPILGFGRTKLYTTVPLDARGADWTAAEGDRRLFVTMPRAGRVAVVDTDRWRVAARIQAGPRPTRIALAPDQRRLWVTNEPAGEPGGVTVIDRATHVVAGRIETGAGPHAVAFSPDGELVFVANRGAGTVSIIDAEGLVKLADLETGAEPADLAYSTADDALYVVHAGDGTVAVVDGLRLEVVRRTVLEPGLHAIRFPPRAGDGMHGHAGHDAHQAHAAHGGHGGEHAPGARPPGPERFAFIVNPSANRLHVLDAVTGQLVRTESMGHAPDQIAFTQTFAYIRSSASPEVALIPLADPTVGGTGSLDRFSAGQSAPAEAGPTGPGEVVAASPDMHDAVFVMNPADRMIYYYHYMEGMPIPSGGLTTYGFEPQAVRVAQKGLRETEPGVYTATVKLPARGDYEVIFLLDEPRVLKCFGGVSVQADPALGRGPVVLGAEPLVESRELRAGVNVVRFRLSDARTGEPLLDLDDAAVTVSTTTSGRARAIGRAVAPGVYEFAFAIASAEVYYLSFDIPSAGVYGRSRPPVIFRAARDTDGDGSRASR